MFFICIKINKNKLLELSNYYCSDIVNDCKNNKINTIYNINL